MKKRYERPTTIWMVVEVERLLAGSDGTVEQTFDEYSDQGELSRGGFDFWDDEE